jgi:hypothetical protein
MPTDAICMREAPLHQQLEDVGRITLVRLLLAHVTGSDLSRIADAHLMTEMIEHVFEPMRVTAGFEAN